MRKRPFSEDRLLLSSPGLTPNRTINQTNCQKMPLFTRPSFKKIFLPSLLALLCIMAQAQDKIHVKGVVRDDKGNPAANATVAVKNTKVGTSTDANGAFSIDVPNKKS